MFFRYEYKGTYIDVDRFNVNAELGKWLDDNNIPQSEFVNIKFVGQFRISTGV